MAQPLVNQPSALPTNKLAVAALIGPAVTEGVGLLFPVLDGGSISMLCGGIAALAVGWIVKDRANT